MALTKGVKTVIASFNKMKGDIRQIQPISERHGSVEVFGAAPWAD